MTDGSMALLEREGFSDHSSIAFTITVKPEGALRVESVFELFDGIDSVRSDGTWKLNHDVKPLAGYEMPNELELEFDHAGRLAGRRLNFAEIDGELVLWITFGDPDQWEFLEYTKEVMPGLKYCLVMAQSPNHQIAK